MSGHYYRCPRCDELNGHKWWCNIRSTMILCALVLLATLHAMASTVPRQAQRYQRDLIRNARAVWGLSAPVAVFGAQIQQESAWNPQARSSFADGLAQFTPQTAEWISGLYAGELGAAQPFNPEWAMRALLRYDRRLWHGLDEAATECDRWAFTLSAYNGGLGWVHREQQAAAEAGKSPGVWWCGVSEFCLRAAAACHENRQYPVRILLKLQPTYVDWGPGVPC